MFATKRMARNIPSTLRSGVQGGNGDADGALVQEKYQMSSVELWQRFFLQPTRSKKNTAVKIKVSG